MSPTLRAQTHGHLPCIIALSAKQQSLVTSENIANTLGANDYKEPQAICYCLQTKYIDRVDAAGCNEKVRALLVVGADMYNQTTTGDKSLTLRAIKSDSDHVPCVIALKVSDKEFRKSLKGVGADMYNGAISGAVSSTLGVNCGISTGRQAVLQCYSLRGNEIDRTDKSKHDGKSTEEIKVVNLTVRRLTPTECARLQGMPDWWASDIEHSDSAEYKMWGNGMALPNILYVMEGLKEFAGEAV